MGWGFRRFQGRTIASYAVHLVSGVSKTETQVNRRREVIVQRLFLYERVIRPENLISVRVYYLGYKGFGEVHSVRVSNTIAELRTVLLEV